MLVGFGSFTCSTFAIAAATTALPLVAGACFDEKSPFDPIDWSHCKKISSNHELYMYYTPLEDTVLLGFHALQDTNGWTALAISGNGGMKGATFYVVRQDDDGSWIAEDRYAMEYAMPTLDEQQDIKLLFAEQDNGQTAWGVAIPQTSCDTKGNDYDIVDRTTSMLWAVGSGHDFGFHVQRGQFEVNLLQAPHEPFDIDASGLSTFEVRMPNVNVVMGDGGTDEMNPYICSYFDLKEIGASAGFSPDETVHVTGFSVVRSPESMQYVHHMLLMECTSQDENDNPYGWEHLKVEPECTAMPKGCTKMKWAWAVGAEPGTFPEDTGLPFGGPSHRFIMLQVHYYNPTLDEGVVDSSGAKFSFTTELKAQEIGIMQLAGALLPEQHPPLPTGQDNLSISFATPSECTLNAWASPLNIIGVGHHMHLYGTHQEINVVRDGVNLGAMRPEIRYDFQHQTFADTNPSLRQLLPGDQITQKCYFDTTNAPGDYVKIGEKTTDEMCYTVIYYYPLQSNEAFGKALPYFDTTTCSQPATTDEFQTANLSLCAESLYSNVQAFYNFNDTIPEYANRQFDLMNVCSGGDTYQDLLLVMPYLCPDCQANFSCHQEDLVIRATEICTSICNEVNLTLYPDLNDTEPYEYGNAACDPQYFPIPSIPEAPACVAKGVSSIDTIEVSGIALKDISYAEDNSKSTVTGSESGSGMVFMDSFVLAIFYATVVILYVTWL